MIANTPITRLTVGTIPVTAVLHRDDIRPVDEPGREGGRSTGDQSDTDGLKDVPRDNGNSEQQPDRNQHPERRGIRCFIEQCAGGFPGRRGTANEREHEHTERGGREPIPHA